MKGCRSRRIGTQDALASLPFVVVGVVSGAVDDRLARPVRRDRRRMATTRSSGLRPTWWSTRSRPPPWPSCSGGRSACPSAEAWWPSLPPTPCCSPGPSSRHGGPRIPARAEKDDGPRVRVDREGDRPHCSPSRDPVGSTRSTRRCGTRSSKRSALAAADPEHRTGRAARRGPSLLRRRRPRRVRHQAGPGDGAPHPPGAERRARAARLQKPVTTYLHGACMGSGIELAAFTDTVVAAADTQIALPEIGLGLVPGAGGTVSLLAASAASARRGWRSRAAPSTPRRPTRWGLVDELAP